MMSVLHNGRKNLCPCVILWWILIPRNSGNCTKHNVPCDYMMKPEAQSSQKTSGNPDLRMTPQIVRDLQSWRKTGIYPFPSLGVTEQPSLVHLSDTDLRLIYHISSIATQIQNSESQDHSVWVKQVPVWVFSYSLYGMDM